MRRHLPSSTALETARCRQILDELLAFVSPADAAIWSVGLINEFGSLPAVLSAGERAQGRVVGSRTDVVAFLRIVREAMVHSVRTEAVAGPVLSNSQALIDYLRMDSAHAPVERFRVLFLNAQNRLLDEFTQDGTVNEAPVYPREIMRRALEQGATALVLAHNHPSGDPRPSERDISVTRRVAEAAATLGIQLHDHLIVARSGWTSFRALGLL